jgi:hypothetical protein
MGYRSDVACAFVFDDELVRDTFHVTAMTKFRDYATERDNKEDSHMAAWTDTDFAWFEEAFKPCTMEGNPVLLMRFEDIKWYPGYASTTFVEDVMMAEAIDRGGAYAFVRIGEEDDDIEQSSDCSEQFKGNDYFYANDYVRVSRSIYIND